MARENRESDGVVSNATWYKDAIIYELHVRAFKDSNDDGIGDFRGLVEQLDYVQDLGATAIWILPFYPSPLKDDGYDIADYTSIHPSYGTMRDFRRFVREAHKRGLRVITELVCNHTSDQHPWFQRARNAPPGSAHRDFYVWSDTPQKYEDVRIIFKDFEHSNWTWDPVAKAYFWHRFYSHQPDLNFDNPRVQTEIIKAMDFWFDAGVDGLRLDAIPYLYEREGTNSENLPETHEFLKKLRTHVDEKYEDRMLLAEANQWPEDAVAYFGDGDECHMSFHFPLMPRMFMGIRMEDRYPIIDILEQTPDIPENSQWAIFLRNHDELTLEMVTDEERDYMYRVYAHDPQMRINLGIRRRLAPLLGNNRRRIELMNGLLMSLPGTPVIYYGDEIGMGDNIYLGDRDSVRTPMQWNSDRNAGFSKANRQRLFLPVIVDPEYHFEAVNVETQQDNPHSLLWWMKRLIALRKRFHAFGQGTLEFLHPENRKVLAFIREYDGERILVLANLSRFVQAVDIDLSRWEGLVPMEMFGRVEFPEITEAPYFITLGPHSFYWFSLEPQRVELLPETSAPGERTLPVLNVTGEWSKILTARGRGSLEDVLPAYLRDRRWFGGKGRVIKSARVKDAIPLDNTGAGVFLAMVLVEYTEGNPESYAIPMAFASGEHAGHLLEHSPQAALARVKVRGGDEGVIFDALFEPAVAEMLLNLIGRRRRVRSNGNQLVANTTRTYRDVMSTAEGPLPPRISGAEQSNTSIIYGHEFILKLFRKIEPGINPDLEIGRFLQENGFDHSPPIAGWLEYEGPGRESMSIGILLEYVNNEGDAWAFTQDALSRYFDRVVTVHDRPDQQALSTENLLALTRQEPPEDAHEYFDTYLDDAWLLGKRTAEMHLTLASDASNPDFAPEQFTTFSQRSIYQSMRTSTRQTMQSLRRMRRRLPEEWIPLADEVLEAEGTLEDRLRQIIQQRIDGIRSRTHGDYHLGQVLFTGKDFTIIDFEGEPARSIGERRLKRPPLRDVAGMIRSFHYAAYAAMFTQQQSGIIREEDAEHIEPWIRHWYVWVASSYLKGYLEAAEGTNILPADEGDLHLLLDVHILEKAVYELAYEMNNRPTWVGIPLQGIRELVGDSQ
ncbi:MAG: maltose alpha-D-glucosyltransferase [Sphaerobacteraceae bacterium]|nr:MAG: maltose alpha-D-glucosyltransferase [Sphaerobacteraceae bacterium]